MPKYWSRDCTTIFITDHYNLKNNRLYFKGKIYPYTYIFMMLAGKPGCEDM
jgi:hypothetical protein